jgi:hypothetical protein
MSDRRWLEVDGLASQIDIATNELAALLIAGDRHAASRVLGGLRVLAWHRRAAVLRGRRHGGPGRRAVARRAGHREISA